MSTPSVVLELRGLELWSLILNPLLLTFKAAWSKPWWCWGEGVDGSLSCWSQDLLSSNYLRLAAVGTHYHDSSMKQDSESVVIYSHSSNISEPTNIAYVTGEEAGDYAGSCGMISRNDMCIVFGSSYERWYRMCAANYTYEAPWQVRGCRVLLTLNSEHPSCSPSISANLSSALYLSSINPLAMPSRVPSRVAANPTVESSILPIVSVYPSIARMITI